MRGGVVDDRDKLFAQVSIFGVTNQADDLVEPLRVSGRCLSPKPSTDWIRSIQKLSREGLVHNCRVGRAGSVSRIEVASGQQRYLQRLEITGADSAAVYVLSVARVRAIHPDVVAPTITQRGHPHSRRFHFRNRSHAIN